MASLWASYTNNPLASNRPPVAIFHFISRPADGRRRRHSRARAGVLLWSRSEERARVKSGESSNTLLCLLLLNFGCFFLELPLDTQEPQPKARRRRLNRRQHCQSIACLLGHTYIPKRKKCSSFYGFHPYRYIVHYIGRLLHIYHAKIVSSKKQKSTVSCRGVTNIYDP